LRARNLMQRLQARFAQGPPRHIDDALEFQVVGRIERHVEIGGGVLDLLPLVEARAAHDPVGQAKGDETVLEGAHLEARAHKNGDLAQVLASPLQLLDVLSNDARLLLVVPTALHLDLLAGAAVGAQRLAETALVVGDEARGRAEDMSSGAIVLLEPDDLGAGKVGFEAKDVVDLRAPPAIDRLIVVTDAADIAAPLGKKPEPQILGDVGVLIFVDQHEQEALLISPEHVGVFLEQPQIFQQQVAEIDGVQLLEPLLIQGIELAALAVGKGERFALWDALRNKPAVLPAVDHGREHPRRPSLLVDVLGVKQLLEQPDLIVGVEYCEGGLQVDKLGVPAQDLHADGMEGAEPWHALDHAADQLADASLHLP